MTDETTRRPEPTNPSVEIVGNASAPFIYFDMASAHAIEGGAIIIEVVARTVVGTGNGQVRNEIVATGHLRTSLQGAQSLQSALNSISLMLTPPPEGPKN